jgi:hypothetical protein
MIRHNGITIDRKWQRVEHRGKARRFGACKFRLLCAMLLAGPKNADELFEIVYGDDPDGGPLTGRDIIDQHIHGLKEQISDIGLELHSSRHHARLRYWLAPSPAARQEAA